MRAKLGLYFVMATALSFVAFAAIALGIEAMGRVSVEIPVTPTPVLTPTSTPITVAEQLAELELNEQRWDALNIDSYRVVVILQQIGSYSMTGDITVRDGHFVDFTLSDIFCTCEILPEVEPSPYSIAASFHSARRILVEVDANPREQSVEIQYDDAYHFPSLITHMVTSHDHPYTHRVITFEPLP